MLERDCLRLTPVIIDPFWSSSSVCQSDALEEVTRWLCAQGQQVINRRAIANAANFNRIVENVLHRVLGEEVTSSSGW